MVDEGKMTEVFADLIRQINTLDPEPDLNSETINRSVWGEIMDAAERHNEPGKFTSFLGWEWSSTTNGANLHRVIFLREGKKTGKEFRPYTALDSDKPEDLWKWLDATSKDTGANFVAIPHNQNISKGLMFPIADSYGKPISKAYAESRMRWEPIVEATQIKGDSETHPMLSPTDEFADFETYEHYIDVGAGDGGRALRRCAARRAERERQGIHREARRTSGKSRETTRVPRLMRGLAIEARVGANPYKFGMIGSTDSHTGMSSAEEDNFWGKMAHRLHPREQRQADRSSQNEGPRHGRGRARRGVGRGKYPRGPLRRLPPQRDLRHHGHASPGALLRRLGFRGGRFLAIFEQVCQTIAYAHARDVVHRDLKPANIMIGSFGEVQVVDWGMGKVLKRDSGVAEKRVEEPPSELSVIETVRSSGHGTKSVIGSVMGTPAYMPPEQAMGLVDQMDERSDVFALGAILCEILTGKPPYVGKQDELIGMAAMSKLDDAHERLAQCGADTQLVELTEQCLLAAPAARPKSAEVVALRIHDYLAQAEAKVHEAQVAAAEERVRASAARSHQKLAYGLVGVVLLGLAASLWFWRDAETQRGVAETHLANFDRVSHVVKLRAARTAEQGFFPAWPRRADAMRAWLATDAKELSDAVPELRALVAALREEALAATEAEAEADRRSHPRFVELQGMLAKLASLQRAHDIEAGRAEAEELTLDAAMLRASARELNDRAWLLISLDRQVFGQEAEGLALARRAAAAVDGEDPAGASDTLAWALYANGLDAEAVRASRRAVELAKEEHAKKFRGYQHRLAELIATGRGARIAVLKAEIAELEAEVHERRPRFKREADTFLHDTLAALITDIETFTANNVDTVKWRLAWAERVEELSITRHRARWNEARRAILAADGVTASPLYGDMPTELTAQIGLIPIGMNPQTKLWEFYHLRSAWDPAAGTDPASVPIPTHRHDGTLEVTAERGLVFVLVPGGTFLMGAQGIDPDRPNYDPGASPDEYPVHSVTLAPFFVSRYEMTQAQWARLSGGEYPSTHTIGVRLNGDPAPAGPMHPVESVSWIMCDDLLRQHGLLLPTEAQWEYGCRAGTSTPWSTGATPETLAGYANVMDETAVHFFPSWGVAESFDDGWSSRAPVGSYAANPFGLFDVHGNVTEWCRDEMGNYVSPVREGDGLRHTGPRRNRIGRGGYSRLAAHFMTSHNRGSYIEALRNAAVGVRPAREITPP